MAIAHFFKQEAEEFPVGADFSENMSSSEVIASEIITATDADGEAVTAEVLENPTNDGAQTALVQVKAGTEAGSPYKITFEAITDAGNTWELDIEMIIKEL